MIYLDNAATTLMKPRAVVKACAKWLDGNCANPGRGGHKLSIRAGNMVYECRELTAQLFNIKKPENVIFTPNATLALNIAIKGFVKKGMHVVISGMEHNSVYRTVCDTGCSFSIAEADSTGFVSLESIKKAVTRDTGLIIIIHASNVVGTINPIEKIGEYAKSKGIALLVDAAQSAGVLDIDAVNSNIDMLAFAGHKSLMGPTGTGGLYISPRISLEPLIFGGTGSVSESPVQPVFLPDRFESGTLNVAGIAGLLEGIKFLQKITLSEIRNHEQTLVGRLLEGLYNMPGVKVYGGSHRVGIVSLDISGKDSVSASNLLDKMNIATRGGLHCSPLAHSSLNTPKGLVRLSVGYFNTPRHIDKAIDAIYKISKK